MKLSVAYTFEKGLIEKLAQFKEVKEVYGKLNSDIFGGGRSSYTLRNATHSDLKKAVITCKSYNIGFNYLLNGATLGGIEQTKGGQKRIHKMLRYLTDLEIESITVSSPYLLKLIKSQYPHFNVRVSVFAVINTPLKAKQWVDMGADTLCLSAISCNRNFKLLEAIRKEVTTELQLIVNASCLIDCAYELTHMNLLTDSSRKGHYLGGMCFDYCILNCTRQRLNNSMNYIRSVWIRPEDLHIYEDLGYTSFKIVERSCPGPLLIKRVRAYASRRFKGNLFEIAGPVAQIKKEQKTPFFQRLRMVLMMLKPWHIKISSLLRIKKFASLLIPHDYTRDATLVYIDNEKLDGFLEKLKEKNCLYTSCSDCDFCQQWTKKSVTIHKKYQEKLSKIASDLDKDAHSSSLWLRGV